MPPESPFIRVLVSTCCRQGVNGAKLYTQGLIAGALFGCDFKFSVVTEEYSDF
jgi:hypothetical protein